jgi:hypothetical protein
MSLLGLLCAFQWVGHDLDHGAMADQRFGDPWDAGAENAASSSSNGSDNNSSRVTGQAVGAGNTA